MTQPTAHEEQLSLSSRHIPAAADRDAAPGQSQEQRGTPGLSPSIPVAAPAEHRSLGQTVEAIAQVIKNVSLPSLAGIFFIVAFIAMTRPSRVLLTDADGTTTTLENPDRAMLVWCLTDQLGEGKTVSRMEIQAPFVKGVLLLRSDPTYRLAVEVMDGQITLVDTHTDSRTGEPAEGKVTITKTLEGILPENGEIALVSFPAKDEMGAFARRLSDCLPACGITTRSGPRIAALPLIGRLFRRKTTLEPNLRSSRTP